MKKNILIISIYYPSIQSIASNRLYSFAKYLDKDKYNIFVHTLNSLQKIEEEKSVMVNRVENDILFRPLIFTKRTNKMLHYSKVIYNKAIKYFFEDGYRGWTKNSLETLPQWVQDKKIDVIISSYAPTAPHVVALRLKRQFPHLKWIADMRDEMSQGVGLPSKIKSKYEKLEQDIFVYADAVTSVSKPILDEFQNMAKNDNLLFREIRNGYDFKINNKSIKNREFTLSYVGNFHGDINPNNFLEALSQLVNKDKISNFKIRFIGVKTHFTIPVNLKFKVEVLPSMPHAKAIEEMQNSDTLLLILPKNGRKGVYTGKLFEYLASLRPIIALVDTEDVAASLIRDCNAGYIGDFDNIDQIKDIILRAYTDWTLGKKKDFNLSLIVKHHRKEQVKRVEKLIEELIDA